MEFAVYQFIGFGDGHDLVHALRQLDVGVGQQSLVAHHADDGHLGSFREMGCESLGFDEFFHMLHRVLGCARLHYNNHR